MQLVTLLEAKERLSIDFNDKDKEITGLINAVEGYLATATGLDLTKLKDEIIKDETLETVDSLLLSTAYVAKEYILLKTYLDYYMAHTEIDDYRLTLLIKQLQINALMRE